MWSCPLSYRVPDVNTASLQLTTASCISSLLSKWVEPRQQLFCHLTLSLLLLCNVNFPLGTNTKLLFLAFLPTPWKPHFSSRWWQTCGRCDQDDKPDLSGVLCRDASCVSCSMFLAGRIIENGCLVHAVDSALYGVLAKY